MSSQRGMLKPLWTAENDRLLKDMVARGLTIGMAAMRLGKTRSSVAGRAHRLKLRFPGMKPGPKPKPKPETPKSVAPKQAPKKKLIAGALVTKSKPRPSETRGKEPAPILHISRPEAFQPIADTTPISLTDAGSTLCKWPVNGLTGCDDRFCGQPKADPTSPYCTAHSPVAFNPAPLKRL